MHAAAHLQAGGISTEPANGSLPHLIRRRAKDQLSIDLGELERKRNVFVAELEAAGYSLRPPEGTFYLWVRSPDRDDAAFVERLAKEGVLVLPGTTCGSPGYFRISLTGTAEMIERSIPVFRSAV